MRKPMNILLVTYDLTRPFHDYAALYNVLDNNPISIRISEYSYAIGTYHTAFEIWQNLQQMIDNDDMLFIIPLASPWDGRAGQKHQDMEDLLKKYLPNKTN
jgi:hypothetical protein